MDEVHTRQQLFKAYQDILSRPDYHLTDAETAGLSGVFLPDVTAAYCKSPVRLMLVGQETKRWNGGWQQYQVGDDFEAYLRAPTMAYREWMTGKPGRHRFLQFHRSLGKRMGSEPGSVIWGNLFATSYNQASPVKCDTNRFNKIQALSSTLLRTQIEILKPHAVIFTTGWRYDPHLKACLGDQLQQSEVHKPKVIWRFMFEQTRCLRTSHPRYAAHNLERNKALLKLIEDAKG
jgi:hypothetical protein